MIHSITGIAQRTTPELVTQYQWVCSCTRRGKWTTAGLAESAAAKHAASGRVIGMNRHAAATLCGQLWGRLGQPFTKIGRRSKEERCQVGYLGHWPNNYVTVMGAGETWEEAFERAQKGDGK